MVGTVHRAGWGKGCQCMQCCEPANQQQPPLSSVPSVACEAVVASPPSAMGEGVTAKLVSHTLLSTNISTAPQDRTYASAEPDCKRPRKQAKFQPQVHSGEQCPLLNFRLRYFTEREISRLMGTIVMSLHCLMPCSFVYVFSCVCM